MKKTKEFIKVFAKFHIIRYSENALGCIKNTKVEATDAGVSVREVQWETEGTKGNCLGGSVSSLRTNTENPSIAPARVFWDLGISHITEWVNLVPS